MFGSAAIQSYRLAIPLAFLCVIRTGLPTLAEPPKRDPAASRGAVKELLRIEVTASKRSIDRGISFYAIAPDSKTMVYCDFDYFEEGKPYRSELVLVDLAKGRVLHRQKGQFSNGGVFSADGKLLATGVATVWDVNRWEPKVRLKPPEGYMFGFPMAFSPDGKFLVGRVQRKGNHWCREDVVLWNLGTGECRVLDAGGAKLLGNSTFSATDCVIYGKDNKPDTFTKAPVGGPFVGFQPTAVSFADDGGSKLMFVEYKEGCWPFTTLWDTTRGKPLATRWLGAIGPARNCRFRGTPSGRILPLPNYKPPAVRARFLEDLTLALGVRPSAYTPFAELCRLEDFKGATTCNCQLSPDGRRLVAVGRWPKTARSEKPVTVLRVWDVSALQALAAKKIKEDGAKREQRWRDLFKDSNLDALVYGVFSPDVSREYSPLQAMLSLVEHGDDAVTWLRKKMGPPFDLKKIPQLIEDLESEQFQTRADAKRELEQRGQLARPFLERALKNNPPAETKKQVQALLIKLKETEQSHEMTQLRIIDVLEHINTKAARALLKLIADGKYDPAFASEAKEALKRAAKKR
jgi:hypothetical protein